MKDTEQTTKIVMEEDREKNQVNITATTSIELPYKVVKIVDAVDQGIKQKVIRIEDNNFYLIRHLFPTEEKARELYVKNLFLYTRVKNITKAGDALYVKDIESDELLAFYKNDQVICLL